MDPRHRRASRTRHLVHSRAAERAWRSRTSDGSRRSRWIWRCHHHEVGLRRGFRGRRLWKERRAAVNERGSKTITRRRPGQRWRAAAIVTPMSGRVMGEVVDDRNASRPRRPPPSFARHPGKSSWRPPPRPEWSRWLMAAATRHGCVLQVVEAGVRQVQLVTSLPARRARRCTARPRPPRRGNRSSLSECPARRGPTVRSRRGRRRRLPSLHELTTTAPSRGTCAERLPERRSSPPSRSG